MNPTLKEYIIFRIWYGNYKYKIILFRFTNNLATFQRHINNVLFDYLNVFYITYLNNIIIYFNDLLKHEIYIKKILAHLQEYSFLTNIRKSKFYVKKIKFLRFFITTKKIKINLIATECIYNWKFLLIIKEVQSFLSFCNFYQRFIFNYKKIAKPLVKLIKPFVSFDITPPYVKAFKKLKLAIFALICLKHYNAALETRIEINASDGIISKILL